MKTYNFVYKTTFSDGRYYIGQHKTDNLNDNYYGSSKIVKKLVKEHPELEPKRIILCYCNNQKELNRMEKFYIGDNWKKDILCLNENNTCGIKEESPMKGKQAWNKGIPISDEQKKNHSNFMKGKMKGEKNPMYGLIGEKHPMYGKISPIKGKHRVYDNAEHTKWHME